MKSVVYTLGLSLALISGAHAQTKPETGSQPVTPTADQPQGGDGNKPGGDSALGKARYTNAMKNLPTGVLDKINAARDAAETAKLEIDKMRSEGKTKEEVDVLVAEKRAGGLANLQVAVDALDNVPEAAKERVGKAKEAISKRLTDRKAEVSAEPGATP